MHLEELLFCVVFFIMPVMGMIGLVIGRVLKGDQSFEPEKQKISFKKRRKNSIFPAFASPKVMEYQIVESQVHIPLQLTKFKERTQQRAGP